MPFLGLATSLINCFYTTNTTIKDIEKMAKALGEHTTITLGAARLCCQGSSCLVTSLRDLGPFAAPNRLRAGLQVIP